MVTEAQRNTIIAEGDWKARAANLHRRLAPFINAHLKRRSRGEKHPVYDFLFEYYSFRPAHLLRWTPGVGVELENGQSLAAGPEFVTSEVGLALDPGKFPAHRIKSVREVLELLRATQERPAFHGCLGLHEWAMVYRSEEVRHGQVELRLSREEIAGLVESQPVCCSHFDAFRFFTPEARPLNVLQPSFEDRVNMEQPGCIHANMDLYKWAYKFYPWISSEIMADAFELAVFAREIDMRASPYDLRGFGYEPIRIETESGRREYQQLQREVARRARPIRARLIGEYEGLVAALLN